MKIKQEEKVFKPVEIVLETKSEIEFMKALSLCNKTTTLDGAATSAEVDFRLLNCFAQELYDLLDKDC